MNSNLTENEYHLRSLSCIQENTHKVEMGVVDVKVSLERDEKDVI